MSHRLDECHLRRPDFLPGRSVLMADHQTWVLPLPVLIDDPTEERLQERYGAQYLATLRAVHQSEDPNDRQRNELALAICLLSRNYDLKPSQFRSLLSFDPGCVVGEQFREAIGEVAENHIRCLSSEPPSPSRVPMGSRLRRWLQRLGWKGREQTGPVAPSGSQP